MQLQTISWLRAYHTGISPNSLDDPELTKSLPPDVKVVPSGELAFFDVQTLDEGAVARFSVDELELSIPIFEGPHRTVQAPASLHYLFHVSGFLVLRLTAEIAGNGLSASIVDQGQASIAGEVNELFWGPRYGGGAHRFGWRHDGVDLSKGTLREIMNAFFLWFCSKRFRKSAKSTLPDFSDEWATLYRKRSDRMNQDFAGKATERLVADRGTPVQFRYPVSFGSHLELVSTGEDREDVVPRLEQLLSPEMKLTRITEIPSQGDDWWGIHEHSSIYASLDAVGPDRQSPSDPGQDNQAQPRQSKLLGVRDPEPLQLIEVLNLRLGSLWSIQRETQRLLAQAARAGRRRKQLDSKTIENWQRILSTANDDWTLDSRGAGRMATIEKCLDATEGVKSLRKLREQVDRNVAVFRQRLDFASERAGLILGIVFGIVAATSLSPILKTAIIATGDVKPDRAPIESWSLREWPLSVGLDIGVIVAVGAFVWWLFRRVSSKTTLSGH